MNQLNHPDNRNRDLSSRRQLRRLVLMLAIPIIAENLLLSMMEYMDTAMVGSLGPNATAAVACVTPVIWVLNSMIIAVGVGGTVVAAQSIGAGDYDRARKTCGQAFLAAAAMALFITALLLGFRHKIPVFMGVEPDIYPIASSYILFLALGMPMHCTSAVFYGILRGAGDTRTPLVLSLCTNIMNIIGNFLLIFPERMVTLGFLSFHMWGAGLGVAGASISSSFARTVSGLIVLVIMTQRHDVTLKLRGLKPEWPLLTEILKIGLPAALEKLAINGGHVMYARLVAGLGTVVLAAHQLAQTAETICFLPAMGFETAATTLAGQSVGAKQYEEGRRRVSMTVELCVCCVMIMAAILFIGCRFLLGLLTPSEDVIAQGVIALRTIAVFEIAYGITAVFAGGLRGVGATREPFYICLGSMWLLRIPLALFLLNFMNGGIGAVWLAMGLDLVLRAILMGYRFHKGSWEQKLRKGELKDD